MQVKLPIHLAMGRVGLRLGPSKMGPTTCVCPGSFGERSPFVILGQSETGNTSCYQLFKHGCNCFLLDSASRHGGHRVPTDVNFNHYDIVIYTTCKHGCMLFTIIVSFCILHCFLCGLCLVGLDFDHLIHFLINACVDISLDYCCIN